MTLEYESYGAPAGLPVVVMHGFPASRLHGELFDGPAQRLGIRIVAPDRPGIGLSAGRLDSLTAIAGAVAELADRLRLTRFGVVGLSGGAPYALACGACLPDRVSGIAIGAGLTPPELGRAGTAPPQRLAMVLAARSRSFRRALLHACRHVAVGHPELFARIARTQLGRADAGEARSPATMESLAREFREAFRQGGAAVELELRLLLSPWPFTPEDVRVPVHLEHGARDRTVPVRAAVALSGRLPSATLTVHAGLGHLSLMAHRAEALLEAVVEPPPGSSHGAAPRGLM